MECYLDNSATTRCLDSAAALMAGILCTDYGNPSSLHHKGVQAEDYVVYQYPMPRTFDVPEGCYLFMGDNRANSRDARYWENPYVSADAIQGRAIFTLYPFSNFGKLK